MLVGEMMSRMTNTEFVYWMAYEGIDPGGEYRADLRAGIIASEIHNSNVTKKHQLKSPAVFMPLIKEPKQKEFNKAKFFSNLKGYVARQRK